MKSATSWRRGAARFEPIFVRMTQILPLNLAWNFRRLPADGGAVETWASVDLPQSPFVADLDGREHWFGLCEYQRSISLPAEAPAGRCTLFVGAAMHSTVVLCDDIECGRHTGGFLPFEIDLGAALRDGLTHTLTLRLDNRDNPDVPPGKPYADLDFCWYGGLYRHAELRCYPALHITDSVGAAMIAGGGVFVRTLGATTETARISVKTQASNTGSIEQVFLCEVEVRCEGNSVARKTSAPLKLAAGASMHIELEMPIARPALWQIDSPVLHHAQVTLRAPDGAEGDTATVRFGIRRIAFSRAGGFTLNGHRLRLRGTNRHQEYPRVGYAVPAAAQRRDARRIKEAGFDYVRLSHYPQSPDFLDACDELGIVVMNCIPGWQFMGGDSFRAACVQNARDLIRRDRNHPCVVLWELSLNETEMDDAFKARLHAAGHEEFPGDQMFTCGWQDRFDVYIHSRQHGEIHRWQNGDKALVIAEYGDWEFFASNHGFDQKTGAGSYANWSHGRQLRDAGERGLRQQSFNHTIALNDTLASPAVFDGQWSVFDYARGYDPLRAACGIMDVFRLPKFSYYFYRSQRDAAMTGPGWSHGPVVFIASHWTPASDLRVVVFSNCEEIELRLDGRVIGREKPVKAWMTQYLPHPPFVFDLPAFSPGSLEAIGFSGGNSVAMHRVRTPAAPAQLNLAIETMDIVAAPDAADVLIAHASVFDRHDTLCIGDSSKVSFSVEGGAKIVGPSSLNAEAGIASVVLHVPAGCVAFTLHASRVGPEGTFGASDVWQYSAQVKSPAAPASLPGGALVAAR